MNKSLSALILTLVFSLLLNAQQKPIGSWTEHLPFQSGNALAFDGDLLYCGTSTGLFTFDPKDNSISRYSTVNRLNAINIVELVYAEELQTLVVIYDDLNIDILRNNQTFNLPFIKEASINTNKVVNNYYLSEPFLYLATGFGVVKMDIERREISETYQFGPGGTAINVNACYVDENSIYAATASGLYVADLNSNLLDFNNWNVRNTGNKTDIQDIFRFSGKTFIVTEQGTNDSILELLPNRLAPAPIQNGFNYLDHFVNGDRLLTIGSIGSRIYDSQFTLLFEDQPNLPFFSDIVFNQDRVFLLNSFHPLLVYDLQGNLVAEVKPPGPFQENIFDLSANGGVVWAVPGGYNQSINNLYRGARIYRYKDNQWTNFIDFATESLNGVYDLISVSSDPRNPNHAVFGSWGEGMVEFNNDLPFSVYNEDNSILKDRNLRPGWVAVGETEFDEQGNLWIVNSYTQNILSVRKANGDWVQFTISGLTSGEETAATEIEISDAGVKWIALPFDNHILVYDDNQTIDNPSDDQSIVLRQGEGNGDVPGIRGITMAFDLDNQLWIGTSDGIAVQYNPDNIFDANNKDFERVLLDGENVEVLLGGTEISDIEVDGANRKWVATNGSGLYLLSPDGKEEIRHFTVDNSPIFSNNVLDVAIDEESGEVFIATANGLLSYRSEVISGEDRLSDIKVFPNPVRENYSGPISIEGLIDQTQLKITDIEGRLVNEIVSQGGRAQWDGRNFSGERVSTGVYLVYSSALNEEESLRTAIAKILFVR